MFKVFFVCLNSCLKVWSHDTITCQLSHLNFPFQQKVVSCESKSWMTKLQLKHRFKMDWYPYSIQQSYNVWESYLEKGKRNLNCIKSELKVKLDHLTYQIQRQILSLCLNVFPPTCPKAKLKINLFIQTNSFIIFTCPNPVLLVSGFGQVG